MIDIINEALGGTIPLDNYIVDVLTHNYDSAHVVLGHKTRDAHIDITIANNKVVKARLYINDVYVEDIVQFKGELI